MSRFGNSCPRERRETCNPRSRTDLITEDETTPEERIESAFNDLRESLVADLRAKLADVNPFRFEQVVLDLLVAMGYGGSS